MKSSKLLSGFFVICVVASSLHPIYASRVASPSTLGIGGSSSNGYGFGPNYYPPIQPLSGPQQTLAILVEFLDAKHILDKVSIDSLIFGEMAKYYYEVSYGQIQIVGKSVGWYTLAHTMEYYGADITPSRPGSDARKVELIRDAIDAVQDAVNFKDYPRIIVVHAGAGQEDSSEASDLIWSEGFWAELSIPTRGGAIVNSAAIVPEMESEGHSPLGVYAHEYGHLLSLPDLYYAELESSAPDPFVGRWSLMGTGLWLGEPRGSSPAELEAWSRIKLGWLTPDIIGLAPSNLSLQLVRLHPLETAAGIRAIQIPIAGGEYYLVEARTKVAYDTYLPGSGVLITRIDETKGSGGGIVQVMDADSSTKTLSDAVFEAEGIFNDTKNRIFLDILSSDGDVFSVLVGNQESASLNLTTTDILAPQSINATYSQPVALSSKLTDQYGHVLAGLPVRLQYYGNGRWNDLGISLTDDKGNARFDEPFPMNPSDYYIRFIFAGRKLGDHYLVGSDQLATLRLRKLSTNLQVLGSQVVQATGNSTSTIKVSDELGRPVKNLRILIFVDGQLIQEGKVSDGSHYFTLNFGLHQLGTHILRVEVKGNTFYESSTKSLQLYVMAPAWLYGLVAAIALVSLSATYFAVRIRHPRKRLTQS